VETCIIMKFIMKFRIIMLRWFADKIAKNIIEQYLILQNIFDLEIIWEIMQYIVSIKSSLKYIVQLVLVCGYYFAIRCQFMTNDIHFWLIKPLKLMMLNRTWMIIFDCVIYLLRKLLTKSSKKSYAFFSFVII